MTEGEALRKAARAAYANAGRSEALKLFRDFLRGKACGELVNQYRINRSAFQLGAELYAKGEISDIEIFLLGFISALD